MLFSCSKVVEYKLPYSGDKIVLNGLLNPDSVIQIRVSKSIPVGQEVAIEQIVISDAIVELWEDSVKIENLYYIQQGIYRSSSQFKPQINKGYRIKVSAINLPPAETETVYIPEIPRLTDAHFTDSIAISSNQAVVGKMRFEVMQTLLADYYWIDFRGYKNGALKYPNQTWIRADANSCGEDHFGMYASFIFSDKCQPFPHFPIQIETETGDYEGRFDSIKVAIAKINPLFYTYQKAIAHQPIGGFDSAFSEGKPLPSNVKGGYGIVVGFSQVGLVFAL